MKMNISKIFKVLVIVLLVLTSLFYFLSTPDISVEELKTLYANEHSKFIEVDGMQVHYRDEGQGMPIVLIHGTAASLHTWDAWTKTLKTDYRVIRLDIPAFGLTGPHPEHDYQIKTYSNFLGKFLNKLKIDSMHLVGNSLGGEIAWYHAAKFPEKIRKLILLDPAGYPFTKGKPWIFTLARTPILNSIIRNFTPKSIVENNLHQVYYDESKVNPELVDRYYKMTLRTGNRDAFIERAKTDLIDQTALLKTIKSPTLIIWGKEDIWISPSNGDSFQADIPNAKLIVMDEVGHVPMEEQPSESLQPVLDFLK